jgi:hypothetical protein
MPPLAGGLCQGAAAAVSRRGQGMQFCTGPCLRQGGRTRPAGPHCRPAPARPLQGGADAERAAAPGAGGFFVYAKQASRKERTQKRHKSIRGKVRSGPGVGRAVRHPGAATH